MTGLVQPFISTVPGSLDSKGRVCIPATHRHLLVAQNTTGVYVCPSFSETALEAFGQSLLENVSARFMTYHAVSGIARYPSECSPACSPLPPDR